MRRRRALSAALGATLGALTLGLWALVAGAQDRPSERPRILVVAIGNQNYERSTPNVDFAQNDAAAFAQHFEKSLGVPAARVIVKNDLDAVAMARFFGRPDLSREGDLHRLVRGRVDQVFIFYSGHGVPGATQGGDAAAPYLLPVDVFPDDPSGGGYPRDALIQQLERLPVAQATLFLDACFSGASEAGSLTPGTSAGVGVGVAALPQRAKVSVLAATAAERAELAHWLPEKRHGAFSWHALQGMAGAADADGDGAVRLTELHGYLNDHMVFDVYARRGATQTPSLSRADADPVIGYAAAQRTTAAVAAEVDPADRTPSPRNPTPPREDRLAVGLGAERTDAPRRPAPPAAIESFKDCDACPEMVAIPAGSFIMGSPASEKGRDANEGPQRRVSIQRFAAGKFEVTFDEWDACAADGFCREIRRGRRPSDGDQGWGRGRRPVITISWNDIHGVPHDDERGVFDWLTGGGARGFLAWLKAKTGHDYRLLSEAEWEYAARAGSTGRFSWGDAEPVCREAAPTGANFGPCSDDRTREVGSFPANAFGLHDMHGNVWEKVEDCWRRNYRGGPTDGSAWMTGAGGDCARAVTRGGGFGWMSADLRSANRILTNRDGRSIYAGFRVARAIGPGGD